MDWLLVIWLIVLVVVVFLVLPICWLILRRRWLARRGGVFDCSLRLRTTTPGTGWVLGVARYSQDTLEWFSAFSPALRPRLTFPRAQTRAGDQRTPTQIESVLLFDDQRIIRLETVGVGSWELSMSTDSLTGLLSWLEAAPPGQGFQGSVPLRPAG